MWLTMLLLCQHVSWSFSLDHDACEQQWEMKLCWFGLELFAGDQFCNCAVHEIAIVSRVCHSLSLSQSSHEQSLVCFIMSLCHVHQIYVWLHCFYSCLCLWKHKSFRRLAFRSFCWIAYLVGWCPDLSLALAMQQQSDIAEMCIFVLIAYILILHDPLHRASANCDVVMFVDVYYNLFLAEQWN